MSGAPKEPEIEKKIELSRSKRKRKIAKLGKFDEDYDVDKFIGDLEQYFGEEVDFNLDKIRQEISKEGKLKKFVSKALQNKTHPVIEFVQEIFKGLNPKN